MNAQQSNEDRAIQRVIDAMANHGERLRALEAREITRTMAQPPPARSEAIGQLAVALAKAQGVMSHAAKDSKNEHFKSNYADLASTVEAIRRPLADNQLSYVQTVIPPVGDADMVLETLLLHASGEWISSRIPVLVLQDKHGNVTPQSMGSAITYARRYALGAICGVAADDDDGEAAMGRFQQRPPQAQQQRPQQGPPQGYGQQQRPQQQAPHAQQQRPQQAPQQQRPPQQQNRAAEQITAGNAAAMAAQRQPPQQAQQQRGGYGSSGMDEYAQRPPQQAQQQTQRPPQEEPPQEEPKTKPRGRSRTAQVAAQLAKRQPQPANEYDEANPPPPDDVPF